MAHHLRALTALPEDPGSLPSTHMVAHNLLLKFQGTRCSLLASVGTRYTSGTQDMCRQNIIKIKINLKESKTKKH